MHVPTSSKLAPTNTHMVKCIRSKLISYIEPIFYVHKTNPQWQNAQHLPILSCTMREGIMTHFILVSSRASSIERPLTWKPSASPRKLPALLVSIWFHEADSMFLTLTSHMWIYPFVVSLLIISNAPRDGPPFDVPASWNPFMPSRPYFSSRSWFHLAHLTSHDLTSYLPLLARVNHFTCLAARNLSSKHLLALGTSVGLSL